MSDLRKRPEGGVDLKIKFYKNFKAYVIVNAILTIIIVLFSLDFWWVLFQVFFWGIGVIIDRFDTESYREDKIQKEMEKLMK